MGGAPQASLMSTFASLVEEKFSLRAKSFTGEAFAEDIHSNIQHLGGATHMTFAHPGFLSLWASLGERLTMGPKNTVLQALGRLWGSLRVPGGQEETGSR